MPEPTVGSQDWLYNLYSDFWNQGDAGIQPTAYDFEQGYALGSPYEMDVLDSDYYAGYQSYTNPFGTEYSVPN